MDANSDRALCRFEYVELIVRLAMKKYNLTDKSKGIGNAVSNPSLNIITSCRKATRPNSQLL
jgi:hypothetical protein